MDTVTQITLGAAVGEATAGKEAGRRAPLWGAFFGLLPDLDVLADPFLTEVQGLVFHRSATHSLLFIALVTVGAAVGLRNLHPSSASVRRWGLLVAGVLLTHVGLDCLTTYGTKIFWPFSNYPVIYGTIFIIDPLYTIPLAAGLLASLQWAPDTRARRWANYAGLALSSAYLLWTVVNKQHVAQVFAEALHNTAPEYERVFTAPTPFNNLLWRGIAEAEEGYYIGFYSLLDDNRSINFRYVPKRHELLGHARDHPIVQKLRHFSRGYYIVRRGGDEALRIYDLRFGRNDLGLTSEGQYLFTYRLQEDPNGRIVGMRQEEPSVRLTGPLLQRFGARILGQTEAGSPSLDAKSE